MSASLNASSKCARFFDLPLGLPLTPETQRCGLPALNDVAGLPDLPGWNWFVFVILKSLNVAFRHIQHTRQRESRVPVSLPRRGELALASGPSGRRASVQGEPFIGAPRLRVRQPSVARK